MSNEVITPGDIAALKSALTQQIINAFMAKQVPETYHMALEWGSCDRGRFEFSAENAGEFYCTYPEGTWHMDVQWAPDRLDGTARSPEQREHSLRRGRTVQRDRQLGLSVD